MLTYVPHITYCGVWALQRCKVACLNLMRNVSVCCVHFTMDAHISFIGRQKSMQPRNLTSYSDVVEMSSVRVGLLMSVSVYKSHRTFMWAMTQRYADRSGRGCVEWFLLSWVGFTWKKIFERSCEARFWLDWIIKRWIMHRTSLIRNHRQVD